MSVVSSFANQSLTIKKKVTTIGADFVPVVTYTTGNTYKACVYSKALSERYVGAGLWKATTEYMAIFDYGVQVELEDKIEFNGKLYAVDSIDDIAFQHEAVFVGLRAVV